MDYNKTPIWLLLTLFYTFEHSVCVQHLSRKYVGCSAKPVLPDQPFMVVWNVPSFKCQSLNLTRYGVTVNRQDTFIGDVISLFYKTGDFPYIANNGSWINGGLPQLGNLTHHLLTLKDEILKLIKDVNYNGLAVLDFEAWRPNFEANYDSLKKYQEFSVELVKKEHPDWTNKTQIYLEAVKEFDMAARTFFQYSLQTAQSVRPGAQWGYYGYPRCKNSKCVEENNRLEWLWETSSGLYPSIYTHTDQSERVKFLDVERIVNETIRVKAQYTSADLLVLPYTKIQYGDTQFFSKKELDISVKLAGEIGSSGVVIWGSSNPFIDLPDECQLLTNYVEDTLGSYVQNLIIFYTNCSQVLCSNHGRCVSKRYHQLYQRYLRKYGRQECLQDSAELTNENDPLGNYVCYCYEGFTGKHCDIS